MSDQSGAVRFEAIVHPRGSAADLVRVADLDLDRLPDAEGEMRVLVDVNDCRALLDAGFEVRLQRALPVQPLAAHQVAADEDVAGWLNEHIRATGGAAEGS